METEAGQSTEEIVDEIRTWLEENWDPDLTVEAWWERLGLAGWSAPNLPTTAYGRGLSRNDSVRVQNEIAEFGALPAPGGLGLMLAAPTIASHGTQEQIDRYVRDIVTGQQAWCQLFSEPGAGSDLAGLGTRAVKDGDEYVVNGQKVWTSLGHIADLGMLLARTNVDVPKHQGITWFALDMHQPGIEVRPLREMTGNALFNEVFITDARTGEDTVIGDLNGGWAVANTTLMNERASLGAGGGSSGFGVALPGTVAGQLPMRAGDFVSAPMKKAKAAAKEASEGEGEGESEGRKPMGPNAAVIFEIAKQNGKAKDATVRQDLVRLYMMGEIARCNNVRMKAARKAGKDIPGLANISKLAMSDLMRLCRDLGYRVLGAEGMLHGYEPEERELIREVTGNHYSAAVTGIGLWAQAPPIYGGTDQIQRNIIGERVLGLPKEPNNDKTVPFAELPKNA